MQSRLIIMLAFASLVIIGCSETDSEKVDKTGSTSSPISAEKVKLQPVSTDSLVQVIQGGDAEVTVVNVWATWCQPCREEFPDMLKVYRELKDEGVRLVLVSADFPEQKSQARQFLAGHQVAFQTYLKTGKDMPFIEALGPDWTGALPATFIYDNTGKLREFWQGKASYKKFKRAIQSLLKQ